MSRCLLSWDDVRTACCLGMTVAGKGKRVKKRIGQAEFVFVSTRVLSHTNLFRIEFGLGTTIINPAGRVQWDERESCVHCTAPLLRSR